MIIQRVSFFPSKGKLPELRELLAERVKANASVSPALLSERIFGAGAPLSISIRSENIEEWEKQREARMANEEHHALRAKVLELSDREEELELFSVVARTSSNQSPTKFVYRVHIYPVHGTVPQVRAALEDYVKVLESEGRAGGVQARQFSELGPGFILNFRGQSMSDYPVVGQGIPQSAQDMLAAIHPNLSKPLESGLSQVIVPFPRR